MNSSVSVVVPVYNAARWLRVALESVIAQHFDEPIEIIVVDDGSTDESGTIIEELQRRHSSIKVLRNGENLGIVASLNRALDEAQGHFIARMDADDICLPTRFSRQIRFLRESGADLCGSWFLEFGNGIPRAVRWPHEEVALRVSMLFQNSICHPTIMARRDVFESYRYREAYRLAEDYDLFVRSMTKFRIANVPEVLLRYRRHPNQATQAQRVPMEEVTKLIRLEALQAVNISAGKEELRLHNLIRAPHSINNIDDLYGIEAWLTRLLASCDDTKAREVIASQWIRACIRAAPLGNKMLGIYRASALRGDTRTLIDLIALSFMKLDYSSRPFAILRRLGLSA